MARADRRRAVREARRVQRRPRAAGGGQHIVEDTMFFPKLRAHAKWMFVLLAAVFSLGFVFLGVGSGSSGIGDLLQGNWSQLFGSSNGTSAQISKDQKKIKQSPKDYAAYRDLAAAQATEGKLDAAIATLQQLKTVAPKNVDGLTQLASLYLQKADTARTAAINAQTRAQETVTPGAFAPASTTPLGKVYKSFTEPVTSRLSSGSTTAFSNAYQKMTSAYAQAVTAYKAVTAVRPDDPGIQFALGQTAEQAQDTKTAIAAYQAFLKLAPEDPSAAAVKARIKTLQAQSAAPTVSSGGSTVTTG
jgi:cytochrome c-type biogenesis protein CcmH/NrfG